VGLTAAPARATGVCNGGQVLSWIDLCSGMCAKCVAPLPQRRRLRPQRRAAGCCPSAAPPAAAPAPRRRLRPPLADLA